MVWFGLVWFWSGRRIAEHTRELQKCLLDGHFRVAYVFSCLQKLTRHSDLNQYHRCENREELDGLCKSLDSAGDLWLTEHVTQRLRMCSCKLYELEWLIDHGVDLADSHFEKGLLTAGSSPELLVKIKGGGKWPSGVASRMLMLVPTYYQHGPDSCQRAVALSLLDRLESRLDRNDFTELMALCGRSDALGVLQACFLDRRDILPQVLDWTICFEHVAHFKTCQFLFEHVPPEALDSNLASRMIGIYKRIPSVLALVAWYTQNRLYRSQS